MAAGVATGGVFVAQGKDCSLRSLSFDSLVIRSQVNSGVRWPHTSSRGTAMQEHALTPEQQAEVEALEAEFRQQLDRVGVDMRAAVSRLRQPQPPVERQISDDEFEVTFTFTVDVS